MPRQPLLIIHNCESIEFESEGLENLPTAFFKISGISRLKLSHGAFQGMSGIRSVEISKSSLIPATHSLQFSVPLVKLLLHQIQALDLPPKFFGASKILNLVILESKIQSLASEFAAGASLGNVTITGSQIDEIGPNAFPKENVENLKIDCRNSKISIFSKQIQS